MSAPQVVVNLMTGFLQRLPLPRLVHFLDMILPQLVPVKSPSRTAPRRFSSSYLAEEMHQETGQVAHFRLRVCHLFCSRAAIMHVYISWDNHPLLLLAAQRIHGRSTTSFQFVTGAASDRSQIQMGLRKGAAVLIHFRRGLILYQSVLLMHDADLRSTKQRWDQHKYWRYVSPVRTYFHWLPENLARTFCEAALAVFPDRRYGEVSHLEVDHNPDFFVMDLQNVHHIGDTKSAQELEVFLTMPRERLRLGCGIQCTETMVPIGTHQRPKLFAAAVKLLKFAIGIDTVRVQNEEEAALRTAMKPLLSLPDGHVLATISAVVLAVREGRTGLNRRCFWCWQDMVSCCPPGRAYGV